MKVKVAVSANRRVTVYHTKDCKNAVKMQNYMEMPRSEAEDKGLTECDECAGRTDHTGSKDFSYFMAAKEAGD
jgi:hypothetical protein